VTPRILILLVLVLALPIVASAGSGARVTTDKSSYVYTGSSHPNDVTMTFTNTGTTTIYLQNSDPFVVMHGSNVIYRPTHLDFITPLAPGDAYVEHWRFTTNCSQSVANEPACSGIFAPGAYAVVWTYATSNTFTQTANASAQFSVNSI